MLRLILPLLALIAATPAAAANLSPAAWPAADRARLEREELSPYPAAARTVQGRESVSATLSPIAAHVGLEALRQGGTAADAAVAVCLTQISTDLGAVVSYAGVAEILYFEARTGRVYAIDAGWGAYADEHDPSSIPQMDTSIVTGSPFRRPEGGAGRMTLVPGFMAGMEAFHRRFGRLRWAELFAPSIWYARNGTRVTPLLGAYFQMEGPRLSQTEDGRLFLAQAGGDTPKFGNTFVQPQLADLLEHVAGRGASYMYSGPWAKAYVAAVRREGGAAKLQDLSRYRPTWETPERITFAGAEVIGPSRANPSGRAILTALSRLGAAPPAEPYWRSPEAFAAYAMAIRAGLIDSAASGHHSASVVVVDKDGNVAAVVHSINAPMWGDTGIVVQGVPISGAAGLYKTRLPGLAPRAHLPSDMAPIIAVRNGKPVLAVASVGSSLQHETVRIAAAGLLGQDLVQAIAAPPLLLNPLAPLGSTLVPTGAYEPAFKDALRRLGLDPQDAPAERVAALRGTVAFASIRDGIATTAETPKTVTFAEAR